MENLTVGALKELLKGVSDETLIVAAIDPEGNAYRPLADHTLGYNYDEDSMEIGLTSLDEDAEGAGFSEDDVMEGGEPCIIFWPK